MTVDFRADLHCHTYCSDGTDSPLELLQKAKEAGLQGLSITDHDTIDAYSPDVFARAEQLGLHLIPGIELSSEFQNSSIHILGYAIDLDSTELRAFLSELIKRRNRRNEEILQRLKTKGFYIAKEELEQFAQNAYAHRTIGRPHIAELMLRKGYVRSIQEAFERYLQEGKPCYVPGIKFTPEEAIEQIHRANGKAVLAHPHFIKKGSVLRKLLSLPFDGLECYYGTLHKKLEQPWVQIAREKQWIATGGSDYHGTIKPHISLGCSWVDRQTFNCLLER